MKQKGGYGVVYQNVMRNKALSPESKAIYAYLSSIAGADDSCYPSVETMQKELGMGKNRLAKHMGQLMALGVVEKARERNGNIYGRNFNKIIHEIRAVENEAVEIRAVENEATTNNNITNNNITNNNTTNQLIVDMYNATCVSFPKVTKLSDRRKKAIKARFNQGYSIQDFKRLFEMAEGSSFLKGGNNRSWSASFDWLITDANMIKVLDGNYQDRQKEKGGVEGGTGNQARGQAADYYKQFIRTSEGGSN